MTPPTPEPTTPAWWSRCRDLARAFGAIADAPSIEDHERPPAPAVFKFGGSCLRDPGEAFARIADFVRPEPRPAVVVLSALHGVTSALERAVARAAARGEVALDEVEGPHRAAIAQLPAGRQAAARHDLDALLAELAATLAEIAARGRESAAQRDRVLAFGERAVVALGAAMLAAHGIADARPLVAEQAGLLTDARAGDASVLRRAAPAIRAALGAPGVHVVAGFVGRDRRGRLTTLGRGGSDYTAAVIAGAFCCPAVLFKDTPGVCAADPLAVPGAPVVSFLAYEQAVLLGRLGAQVVFEKAVVEAARRGVPIVVRAFAADDPGRHPGTIIGPALADDGRGELPPRALACAEGVALGAEDELAPEPLARLTTLGAGAHTVLAGRPGRRRGGRERASLPDGGGRRLALVSILGEPDRPAGRAQVLECLGRADVTPLAIGAALGGAALSVVVEGERAAAAMRALHAGVLAPRGSSA